MNQTNSVLGSASGSHYRPLSSTQKILYLLIMLGLLRSIGHVPVYIGYLAPLAGTMAIPEAKNHY